MPALACECDEPAAIRGLVSAGLGVAFLPAIGWVSDANPGLVGLRVEEPVCQRTIALAWREDRYLSLAARQFRQFVLDHFAHLAQRSAHKGLIRNTHDGFDGDVR
jgi:DNA-binding transcriptional LysR family regulator